MKIGLCLSFGVPAAMAVCAFAQETAHVMAVGGDVHYFSMQMGPGDKVVKGAPYTAEAVTETVQTLANGTRITHQSTAQLARDAEGRTRREQTLDAVGPWSTGGEAPKFIMLHDVVAGVGYHLDPKTNTAIKMPLPKGDIHGEPGLQQQFFVNQALGPHVVVDTVDTVRIAPPPPHEAVAMRAGGMPVKMKDPGEVKTESLGKQTIQGVAVTGTRTTQTIAAGKIGNDQPIEIISETWYSPDLQTVIMSKHSDPQIGETTYRLTNIVQGEPAHSLFEVPVNYAIREADKGDKPVIIETTGGNSK